MKKWGLKLEARRPGSVSKGGYPTVVAKLATVKADLLHAGRLGSLCHCPADSFCSLLIAAESDSIADLLVHRTRGSQRAARRVIDDLGVDVLVGAKHRQPRTLRGAAEVATNTVATS